MKIGTIKGINEDVWGDLECLYRTCQTAITGGFFTETGVNKPGENE